MTGRATASAATPRRPLAGVRRLVAVLVLVVVSGPSAWAQSPAEAGEAAAGGDTIRRALDDASDGASDSEPDGEAVDRPADDAALDAGAEGPLPTPAADTAAEQVEQAAGEVQAGLDQSRAALERVEDSAAEQDLRIGIPEPCTGPWDWVQYSSGEWLRGEFKRMRKKRFEMRSTRFDRRTTDWKHVKAFCFPGVTRFILYDHTVLVGHGRLEGGVLTVTSGDVVQRAPRADVWVMLPGARTEINRWRATTSIGLDTYTGNTDQVGLTASASVDREAPITHLQLAYTGTFSGVDGETTAAQHRASESFNVYFTRALYASLPFTDYRSDRFQNLQHRVIPGLGLGYEIFDLDDFEWSVDGGLAYQYTQYVSLPDDQSLRENDWGPRLGTDLEWDIVTDLTLSLSHYSVVLVRDFDQTNFHTQADLTYEITDLLYVELGFWHDRIRQPRENQQGVTPEKDDYHYVFSLGLNFD